MRLAHIADLHLSGEHQRHNIRHTRRLLETIVRLGVDHVVITGDILADAAEGDARTARSLLASFDLLDPGRLTVVPGNHDIFGGVHHAQDILTFPQRCRATDYGAKLRAFRSWFGEAYEGAYLPGHRDGTPFAKVVGDSLLVGLNSVAPYSSLWNPLGSNGFVQEEERERVASMLSASMFRKMTKIVLIHHHFHKLDTTPPGVVQTVWGAVERQTMKLRGKRELLRIFQANDVQLVLHGHHHRTMEYHRRGIRFLNAGGSVLEDGGTRLSLNLIDVLDGRCSVSVYRLPVSSSRPDGTDRPAVLPQAA